MTSPDRSAPFEVEVQGHRFRVSPRGPYTLDFEWLNGPAAGSVPTWLTLPYGFTVAAPGLAAGRSASGLAESIRSFLVSFYADAADYYESLSLSLGPPDDSEQEEAMDPEDVEQYRISRAAFIRSLSHEVEEIVRAEPEQGCFWVHPIDRKTEHKVTIDLDFWIRRTRSSLRYASEHLEEAIYAGDGVTKSLRMVAWGFEEVDD